MLVLWVIKSLLLLRSVRIGHMSTPPPSRVTQRINTLILCDGYENTLANTHARTHTHTHTHPPPPLYGWQIGCVKVSQACIPSHRGQWTCQRAHSTTEEQMLRSSRVRTKPGDVKSHDRPDQYGKSSFTINTARSRVDGQWWSGSRGSISFTTRCQQFTMALWPDLWRDQSALRSMLAGRSGFNLSNGGGFGDPVSSEATTYGAQKTESSCLGALRLLEGHCEWSYEWKDHNNRDPVRWRCRC